ncbi:MAG: hypothetical protein ACREBS_05260 [Nitrososphaerales archaeon]
MISRSQRAVSTIVFTAAVVILIIIAAIGWTLYSTKAAVSLGQTATITTTLSGGSVVTTTVKSTITATGTGPSSASKLPQTPGFYNNTVVVFTYPKDYNCTPGLLKFFSNQSAPAGKTQCEVGAGNSTAVSGSVPLWIVVPAYAGLSIFGVTQLGASPEGFPTFNNATILTDCGAGGTPSGCPDHPTYLYSPFFTAVEKHINITSGVFGLPEGVLPTPSHDHLINCCLQIVPWYTIAVLVFDPNIMPNPVTGRCEQVVPSNLTNPTGNCLSSFKGLTNALTNHSSAVVSANSNNPIWQTLGGPSNQVVIPGVATAAQISNTNTNLFEFFTVNSTNPYLYNSTGK